MAIDLRKLTQIFHLEMGLFGGREKGSLVMGVVNGLSYPSLMQQCRHVHDYPEPTIHLRFCLVEQIYACGEYSVPKQVRGPLHHVKSCRWRFVMALCPGFREDLGWHQQLRVYWMYPYIENQ